MNEKFGKEWLQKKEQIAFALKEARNRQGMTQTQCAELINRGEAYYRDFEKGKGELEAGELFVLCSYFNLLVLPCSEENFAMLMGENVHTVLDAIASQSAMMSQLIDVACGQAKELEKLKKERTICIGGFKREIA